MVMLVEMATDRGGDGEARWNTQTETTHLSETGTLAAEKGLHGDGAVGDAAAEGEDVTEWRHVREGRVGRRDGGGRR